MGCDIHAMFERTEKISDKFSIWLNSGNPNISRYYRIFGVLANVRNNGHPYISEPRLTYNEIDNEEFDCCLEFLALARYWGCDGHSHSYVTLKELKGFDINQTYCASTTGRHLGEVGDTTIFGVFGSASWDALIAYGENIRSQHDLTDEEVRLVFFFDN